MQVVLEVFGFITIAYLVTCLACAMFLPASKLRDRS
jgi:hypothetical protein